MIAGMVHYAGENHTRLIAEGIESEAERGLQDDHRSRGRPGLWAT